MNLPSMALTEEERASQDPATSLASVDRDLQVGGMASGLPRLSAQSALKLGRIQAFRDALSSLPFIVCDTFAVIVAMLCSGVVAKLSEDAGIFTQPAFSLGVLLLTLLFQHIHGLYPACGLTYSIEYRRIVRTCLMVATGLGVGLLMHAEIHGFPLYEFLVFCVGLGTFLSSFRSFSRRILGFQNWWTQPVVIVGSSKRALSLFERLNSCRNEGLRPLGLVFEPNDCWGEEHKHTEVFLCPVAELEELLLQTGTCRVAVADDRLHWQDYQSFHGIPHVMLPTELGAHPCERARLVERDGSIELHCHSGLTHPGSLMAKRFLELGMVICTLPCWLPLMAAIVIVMKWTDPGPIFYRQNRVGRFGKSFRAIKFRSMVINADLKLKSYLDSHPELKAEWEKTHKLQKDPRVTTIGNFLRKSSLDELPQLFNVLCGEMSLVGPRPIIAGGDYDQKYIEEHPEVFELYQLVRPGITGLWQISGRNALPYDQRVSLDRYYLHNWCLMLDIFILWRTVKTAMFREGAY